ncbi:hypothetical protein PV08_08393 [Exophiala spinifera]|uniref:Transcription elongation factor Eaf N-terminal domain-containing protein n=1 Tax=Exophiala spinifera TaxID=91928 RepID=A0A0D1YDS5_9EURO|nr:uncharacterized protein PV08_08393 [Exophiala spinifera]KIW13206.1 hypothetical protein PV08_08393 [Exophiala spinifera]
MASPAMHPIRPGVVDPRRPGEYPIVLGDSLKKDGNSNSFINIRYNWQPKAGFQSRDSTLTESGDKYSLVVQGEDSDDGEYRYKGTLQPHKSGTNKEPSTSLALVFDKSKSAFVLESLSASLDMNLKSGPGQPAKDARELPQLSSDRQPSKHSSQANGDNSAPPSPNDEGPDPSNPYDFRNFLAEARENIDKSSQQQGNWTPNPGGMTPLSGVSTPVPGSSRFKPTTPQFRPTTKAPHKANRSPERPRARASSGASKTVSKRDATAASATKASTQQPLSKARITDSDEDSDDDDNTTIAVSRSKNPAPTSTTKTAKSSAQPARKAHQQHSRNISAATDASPHIIINDNDGDLEIDMGSPPPEDHRARRARVDPEMFRSHTGTPIGGVSSNAAKPPSSSTRGLPRSNDKDSAHGRAGTAAGARDRDGDMRMKDIEADSDEDGDVEEFELGSPQEKQSSVPIGGDVSKLGDDERRQRRQQHDSQQSPQHATATAAAAAAAPPPPQAAPEDEDDEGFLEAALEAAFGEEDDEQAGHGVGLGIGMGVQDDESEVSEEE